MSEELKVSSEQVKLLAKECEEFIFMIEIQKSEATEQKEIVDAEAVIIKREEIICLDLAATARADLEVVLPMIDAAVKALDALNKKDIAEVKSYGRPPMKIEKVMEAVLILLGKEPTWENAKKVLRKLVEEEYDFILKGGIILDKQGQAPNPAKWWISEQNWDNITELDKVPGFHGIIDSFETNFKSWNAWYATTFPEQEDLVAWGKVKHLWQQN
ncbi:hypothetical protein ACLKA6_007309 [Drosophila palustris]